MTVLSKLDFLFDPTKFESLSTKNRRLLVFGIFLIYSCLHLFAENFLLKETIFFTNEELSNQLLLSLLSSMIFLVKTSIIQYFLLKILGSPANFLGSVAIIVFGVFAPQIVIDPVLVSLTKFVILDGATMRVPVMAVTYILSAFRVAWAIVVFKNFSRLNWIKTVSALIILVLLNFALQKLVAMVAPNFAINLFS